MMWTEVREDHDEAYIDVQESDLGRIGVPSVMDYVTAGEAYEKRCEEVVAIWPDDVIDKLKTEAGLVKI